MYRQNRSSPSRLSPILQRFEFCVSDECLNRVFTPGLVERTGYWTFSFS